MPQEIFWLVLTALMTALFWVPYVLDRMVTRGLFGAMANPSADAAAPSAWAKRSKDAHQNAVENLVVFAPLALAVQAMGVSSSLTAQACMVYFFARLAHFLIYTAGTPVIRTLAFVTGFAAQLVLALVLLGVI